MTNCPHILGVAHWVIHEIEQDCELIIRTNNGLVFYCQILLTNLLHSPSLTEQYFRCLHLLRLRGERTDDFYYGYYFCYGHALDWLLKAFEPLAVDIATSHPSSPPQIRGPPSLSQYLFAVPFFCGLAATRGDKLLPFIRHQIHGARSPGLLVDEQFLADLDLDPWTQCYHPSNVGLCYDHPEDVLIKRPPDRVQVVHNGNAIFCFFKRFDESLGAQDAEDKLIMYRNMCLENFSGPPDALVSCWHGVVRDGRKLFGLLFNRYVGHLLDW